MKNKENGYTLVELMIVVVVILIPIFIVFYFVGIGAGIRGNFYWTTEGVERQLKEEYPEIDHILLSPSERNVFATSKIVAIEKTTAGPTKSENIVIFCLDTNIMFDYRFSKCETKQAKGP